MRHRRRSDEPPPPQVDLHGLTAEKAKLAVLEVVTRHAHQPGVVIRIIHGLGAGILAGVVDQVAGVDARVASVRRDPQNPGVSLLCIARRASAARLRTTRYALDLDAPPERRRKGR